MNISDITNQKHISLQDGTTHILWALGKGPLYSLNNIDISNDKLANSGNIHI